MSLVSQLQTAFTRVGTEFKAIRTLIGGSATADITGLTTTDKSSLVAAINEVDANAGGTPSDASETVKGIVELATQAETNTGTDDVRAITPLKFATRLAAVVVDASATVKGIVELATDAETTTGTDTTRATTPANVKAAIDARTASATAAGIVELATDAETTTGTDTARATTPANVKAAIDARTASATAQGIVELATNAETLTGTDTARAVTPAGLASLKGVANGLASLDGSGFIPSAQIPGSYDEVLEYANFAAFPGTGSTGKIYIALDTNLTYRWSGSAYAALDPSLALGETSTTAYRGDRGKTAYDHSQTTGNPHGTTAADVGALSTANAGDHTTDFAAGFVAALS